VHPGADYSHSKVGATLDTPTIIQIEMVKSIEELTPTEMKAFMNRQISKGLQPYLKRHRGKLKIYYY